MAPPAWTTDEQREWLTALKPVFHDARNKGSLRNWRRTLGHNWFIKWPEINILFGDVPRASLTPEQQTELAAAEEKRKEVS